MKKILYSFVITFICFVWLSFAEDGVFYDTGANVTYIDTEWNQFTWIWTITFSIWDYATTILDRNLWAVSAIQPSRCSEYWCWWDVAFWYYFQWWNNYGFTSGSAKLLATSTQVDAWNYSWSNPYVNWVFVSWYTNWDRNWTQNLWGWEWDTTLLWTEWFDFDWFTDTTDIWYTMQWPCPEWYHVPSKWEWWELIKAFSYYYNWLEYKSWEFDWNFQVDDVNFRTKFDSSFLLPYAGYLTEKGMLIDNNNRWYLWTNTPEEYYYDNDWHAALSLRFFWNRTTNYVSWSKSFGLPIRCFKDKWNTWFVLSYDTRWWSFMQWQTIPTSWLAHVPWYDPKKIWHQFLGWYSDEDLSKPFAFWYIEWADPEILTWNKTIYAKWDDDIVITFLDYDWHKLDVQIVHEWDSAFTEIYPIRDWYTFVGWDKNLDNITGDVIVTAIYKENKKSYWGWWSSLKKDNCPDGDYSDSYYDWICWMPENDAENSRESLSWSNNKDSSLPSSLEWQEILSPSDSSFTKEQKEAYDRAYENWIPTMATIQKADLNGNLTRIVMAKMLSQYAINVLWMTPDETRINKFNDVNENLDSEYNSWVSRAYQLWIMWINMPDERFRPFDLVPRSEFVTALSRMKYRTPDGKDVYYSTHMELLNKLWIVKVMDPTMLELRGYVMLMLMRSEK